MKLRNEILTKGFCWTQEYAHLGESRRGSLARVRVLQGDVIDSQILQLRKTVEQPCGYGLHARFAKAPRLMNPRHARESKDRNRQT